VVGHADDGPIADLEVGRSDLNSALSQIDNLSAQMMQIDDHTVPHNIGYIFVENTGWNQIQNERTARIDYGMAGVIAALIPDNDVIVLTDQIDHASLAFISPVNSSDGCQHRHSFLPEFSHLLGYGTRPIKNTAQLFRYGRFGLLSIPFRLYTDGAELSSKIVDGKCGK